MITKFVVILLISLQSALAADLPALKILFTENYNIFYRPAYCGKNIAKLADEANKRNINLDNAYVLKIVGAGFFETSGFYTRQNVNERAMLGYFHMVLVADGYVFDFDLDEPLVLKLDDYIRLQFTPPYEPYLLFGTEYRASSHLLWWTVTRFEWSDYIRNKEISTWTRKMPEYIDLEKVLSKKRIR
jgi:hypothetical protein